MWFLFALSSSFLYSFRSVLEKKIIHRTNKYVLGYGIRLFAMPLFFIPLILDHHQIIPLHELGLNFWLPILILCFISTPLETIFYYEALKEEELSLAVPILSLAPVLTMFIGIFVFRQIPTVYGVIGVAFLIAGIYSLKLNHAKEGLLEPIKHLKQSRGVRLMLIVMVSISFGAILDKIAVTASNPYMYAAVNYTVLCVTLFFLTWYKARKHLGQLLTHFKAFSILGCVVAGYTLFYLLALQNGNAAYVIAIRNASVIFTIILGLVLFKEKGRSYKLVAGLFIFLGLVFIKVLG